MRRAWSPTIRSQRAAGAYHRSSTMSVSSWAKATRLSSTRSSPSCETSRDREGRRASPKTRTSGSAYEVAVYSMRGDVRTPPHPAARDRPGMGLWRSPYVPAHGEHGALVRRTARTRLRRGPAALTVSRGLTARRRPGAGEPRRLRPGAHRHRRGSVVRPGRALAPNRRRPGSPHSERQHPPLPGVLLRSTGAGPRGGDAAMIAAFLVILQVLVATAITPLLVGVMRQVRARMEGRVGAGLLQPYRDVRKLLAKEPLRAEGSSIVLNAAPLVLLVSR